MSAKSSCRRDVERPAGAFIRTKGLEEQQTTEPTDRKLPPYRVEGVEGGKSSQSP